MKRGTSTVGGSLRAISIALVLIAAVTFGTVGYSAYQAYSGVVSPSFSQSLRQKATMSGGMLTLTMSGHFVNAGLYPIDFATRLAGAGSSAVSEPVSIPAGQERQFNLTASLDPLGGPSSSSAAGVFYNGSDLPVEAGFSASLVPFATLNASTKTDVHLAPFAGNLHVASAVATGIRAELTIAFTDEEAAPYPFTAYAILARSGAPLDSSSFSGVATPGQQTSFTLTFTGSNFASGTYPVILHVVVGGHDLQARLNAEVG